MKIATVTQDAACAMPRCGVMNAAICRRVAPSVERHLITAFTAQTATAINKTRLTSRKGQTGKSPNRRTTNHQGKPIIPGRALHDKEEIENEVQ